MHGLVRHPVVMTLKHLLDCPNTAASGLSCDTSIDASLSHKLGSHTTSSGSTVQGGVMTGMQVLIDV